MVFLLPMSQKQISRYDVIRRLLRKEINGTEAAAMLRVTARQVRRLKKKVRKHGAQGLIHGNRGKAGHNRVTEGERKKIVKLLHDRYADFGPTLANEKLMERDGINRDVKTIRKYMIEEKLWEVHTKKKEEHREWRERRSHYGEMEQFDGSYEYWFEERGEKCCLLASIDDATSEVTYAKFDEHEGVFPVMEFWKEYLGIHGKPQSVYLDKFSTYKMNQKVAAENEDTVTQFQRASHELGITLISANSPEAKGRVERLFQTLQDRLIKELRLWGINTKEKANEFLVKEFLPKFNARFRVEAKSKVNLHGPMNEKEKRELGNILCRHTRRTVQNDFTITYRKQWYQLTEEQAVTICKKDKVMIEEKRDGSIGIRVRGKLLNYRALPVRPKPLGKKVPWVLAAQGSQTKKIYIPPKDHPWRKRFLTTVSHKQIYSTRTF